MTNDDKREGTCSPEKKKKKNLLAKLLKHRSAKQVVSLAFVCAPKGESWSQVLLTEIVETEDGNCTCHGAMLYFVKKAQERLTQRCRAFQERVGSRILLLESVDYFGTSECFTENFDAEAINWSGVVNFHGMKMSLMITMRLIFGDD